MYGQTILHGICTIGSSSETMPQREMLLSGRYSLNAGARAGAYVAPHEKNGPELWDKILNAVREIYEPEYVCVAGGAVRDYLLDVDAKDIDIFLCIDHTIDNKEAFLDTEAIMEDAGCLGWKNLVPLGDANYQKGNKNASTLFVFQGQVFGWNVDVIVTTAKSGEEVVNGFDAYICQNWYDGEIHSSSAAKEDIPKKLWRLRKGLKPEQALKNRFERVNKRLKGLLTWYEGEPWYAKFNTNPKIR
jgi:hypothetical protein